ncbi:hypothetical protein [Streptomyces ipomoeae]|uniref:hypothetical protein n=1 Tax=Streptomyces ipomoeae TaxID=103232 RepID=UPI0029B666B8|nr:hypothetical protein [Streptomyces ipomoeae]MDX2695927.1 hypothetical protein [Streptomyces ipomoeae]
MSGLRAQRLAARRAERRRAVRRKAMVVGAAAVAVVGTVTGMMTAFGGEPGTDEARPLVSGSPGLRLRSSVPTPDSPLLPSLRCQRN